MMNFSQDLQSVYDLAERESSLPRLVDAIVEMLSRHPDTLRGITHSYRLHLTDTGFSQAFALQKGVLSPLSPNDAADVTVSGSTQNLLLLFQRKLNPAKALLLGKVAVQGNKAALFTLGKFL